MCFRAALLSPWVTVDCNTIDSFKQSVLVEKQDLFLNTHQRLLLFCN